MIARVERARMPAARGRPASGANMRGAGNLMLGVFIGVVIGLAIAAAAAFYVLRTGNPYQNVPGPAARDSTAKAGRAETTTPEKPRFDFYKILPGAQEPTVQPRAPERFGDRATSEQAAAPERGAAGDNRTADKSPPASAPPSSERFWLQAGSFATDIDAENLKARLALAGWEASVQEANVPEKGVRFRVRLGPYDNTDELNRVKGELMRRGFEVAVIK